MMFDFFNEDWALTFATIEDIFWFLLLYLIFLLIMSIFLTFAINLFSSAKNSGFGSVFLTSFVITVFYAIVFLFLQGWLAWIIVLIVAWLIISARHHIGFLGAILATVIAFILYVIVAIVLGILLNVTLIVLPF